MLHDLTAEFLSAAAAADPLQAYHRYFEQHESILTAYWRNYILDPESSEAQRVIQRAVNADRRDLDHMLGHVDVKRMAEETFARCHELFQIDRSVDLYLMVGVGGANAGELVVDGTGSAFICLEHFTGKANVETNGLGLDPRLIPLWIAHEVAHLVRYTSPLSQSDIARVIFEAGGYYDCWEVGSQVLLAELLVNEGLSVAASRVIAPDFDLRDYLGYGGRQLRRLRELEAFMRRSMRKDLAETGVGHRLRYLTGGVSPASRVLAGKVLPERSGYYIGYRMVQDFVAEHGIAASLRASTDAILGKFGDVTGVQTA